MSKKMSKEEVKFSKYQNFYSLYPIMVMGFGIGIDKTNKQIFLAFYTGTPPFEDDKESTTLIVGHYVISEKLAKDLVDALSGALKSLEEEGEAEKSK